MVIATLMCPSCKKPMDFIYLQHRYNKREHASLVKHFCPKCKLVELTGDDIDFFIFGGRK
jgi:uncharacterized protein YbaR (Trm112 family)